MVFPKVLAVVPAYNSAEFIDKTIISLIKQDYPYLRSIVIDDCSSDRTLEVLKKYNGKIQIIHNETNHGLAWNLNHALSLINDEELFVIVEDDVELVDSDYITKGVRHFSNKDIAIVCGQPIGFSAKRLSLLDRTYARYLNYDFLTTGTIEMNYSYIKADIISAAALKQIGGFGFAGNPKLGAEDQILANRIRSRGYTILKDSSLRYHLGFARMRGLKGFFKSEMNAGKTLGAAVSQKTISVSPHNSPESRAKSIYRRTQVITLLLYFIALLTMFFSYKVGLIILAGTIIFHCINNIVRSKGFFWKEKPYFLVVGIINDFVFSSSFYYIFVLLRIRSWWRRMEIAFRKLNLRFAK